MAVQPKTMTADELFALPEDGLRHELVCGELRTMSPPGEEHAWLTALLTSSLVNACQASSAGRVLAGEPGFRLTSDPDTVRAPDVAFIRTSRLKGAPGRGYVQEAPDIAIEVISPNDRYTEVDEQVAQWLEHGTTLVLVANPRTQTVSEHRQGQAIRRLTVDDTLRAEDLIPGWRLPLKDLFAAS